MDTVFGFLQLGVEIFYFLFRNIGKPGQAPAILFNYFNLYSFCFRLEALPIPLMDSQSGAHGHNVPGPAVQTCCACVNALASNKTIRAAVVPRQK